MQNGVMQEQRSVAARQEASQLHPNLVCLKQVPI